MIFHNPIAKGSWARLEIRVRVFYKPFQSRRWQGNKYYGRLCLLWFVASFALFSGMARLGYAAGIPSFEINICDTGAIGDGQTLCTPAIQNAIDRVFQAGGGRVVFPAGKYLSGTITLRSNVELHFEEDATLLGSTRIEDYPPHPLPKYRSLGDKDGFPALIYAEGADHVALTGPGTIDGQGAAFQRDEKKARDEDVRPRGILLISCKDVHVQGGLYLRNAGSWMQHYLNCENLEIHDIEVFNHSTANNDCIDIDGCRHVRVSGIHGDSYDDGITLKATGPADCEDVLVEDCVIASHSNGIKCGTESTGGFKHIRIHNITVIPSVVAKHGYGARRGKAGIGLMITDGGTLDDVTISHVTIQGPESPFFIMLGNRNRKFTDGIAEPNVGSVRNIMLSDISVSEVSSNCSWICGLPGHPIENVTLRNINIREPGYAVPIPDYSNQEKGTKYPNHTLYYRQPASCCFIRHASNIKIEHLSFTSTSSETRPPLLAVDVDGLVIDNPNGFLPDKCPPFLRGHGVSGVKFTRPQNWDGVGMDIKP